jgi:hypothetical protein
MREIALLAHSVWLPTQLPTPTPWQISRHRAGFDEDGGGYGHNCGCIPGDRSSTCASDA